MARHRQLFAGREDPHPDVAAAFRREHERALGEIHLPRDRLHHRGIDAARFGKHGELVPLERVIGEDVEVEVTERGHLMILNPWR